MGLVKLGKAPFIGLVALAVLPWATGCKSSKNDRVSSQAFLAPQLVKADPNTDTTPQGLKPIDVQVNKLSILREVHRLPDGTVDKLDSELRAIPARLIPIGKTDDSHLVVYESESKSILSINLRTNAVRRQMTRDEFLALFRGQAQKPVIGPPNATVKLTNGWILGFESSSKSLYAFKGDPDDPEGILSALVMDQTDIQSDIFGEGRSKVQVSVKSLVEFDRDHLLLIPANTNLTGLYHLQVTEQLVGGRLTLAGKIVMDVFVDETTGNDILIPLLDFIQIKAKTGNTDVDVMDFPPVKVPGAMCLVLFDRARATSSFLAVDIDIDQFARYSTRVSLLTTRVDLVAALRASNQGGDDYTGEFRMTSSFLNPDAGLAADNPSRKPLLYGFDDETNTIFSLDFTKPRSDPTKVQVFTSSTMLSSRTDLRKDLLLDQGTFDPSLTFAPDNMVNNKLCYDSGPEQLVAVNFEVGQVVVIAHKRDITAQTGTGTLSVRFMESVDDNTILLVDSESSSLLYMRVVYVAIPIVFPRA